MSVSRGRTYLARPPSSLAFERPLEPPPSSPRRCGYVALVGRPNSGKSTLLNTFLGEHLSIVTSKAQTTWRRVTGILTRGSSQLIFLDTPGLLEARDLLQKAMLGAALEALLEADVVLTVVDATREPRPRDTAQILDALEEVTVPIHMVLNKIDEAEETTLREWESWIGSRTEARGHRVSALDGSGTEELLRAVEADLPLGPFLYPEDDIASDPIRFFVAEMVRETIFELYEQEIPYSVICQVGEFREAQDPIYIQMNVFVERRSQKGILIGKGGAAIRELGSRARAKIEHFLGRDVYLDLWVKPLKAWRKSKARLRQLGFRVPDDAD